MKTTGVSLGDALGGHRNSLGLLRLVLAASVIFHHSFPLLGLDDPILAATRGQAGIGTVAVAGFFAISGYLIAKSGMSSDVVQFLWRRVLRIFPAYWFLLLVSATIVGPAIWLTMGRSLATYFQPTPGGPLSYLAANWTLDIGTYGIYDIFQATTPYGITTGASVFNGSIWTLVYEWHCYLLIAVLVASGVLINARIIVPVLTAFAVVAQIAQSIDPVGFAAVFPYLADTNRVSLFLVFLVGSTIAVYSKRIPFDDRLGILSIIVLLLTLRYGGYDTIGVVAGAYFVLYLAARLPAATQWIGAKNDYSYGVYIYGFLAQQVLAHLGLDALGYVAFSLIALVMAFVAAWVSWHLVEKRALALKDRGPGRGIRFWLDGVRARTTRGTAATTKED